MKSQRGDKDENYNSNLTHGGWEKRRTLQLGAQPCTSANWALMASNLAFSCTALATLFLSNGSETQGITKLAHRNPWWQQCNAHFTLKAPVSPVQSLEVIKFPIYTYIWSNKEYIYQAQYNTCVTKHVCSIKKWKHRKRVLCGPPGLWYIPHTFPLNMCHLQSWDGCSLLNTVKKAYLPRKCICFSTVENSFSAKLWPHGQKSHIYPICKILKKNT